ncbi:uncharacterized protein TNCV_3642171 [Trichonephila clavipes]|nr:uncharacterized protein TNCV_3642171 [Trichonephila clavipes]
MPPVHYTSCADGVMRTVWGIVSSPGPPHPYTAIICPQTIRDSSLNTTFCQSVTFHIDLIVSARSLEIVCGTISTPTSARIVERVTVELTSACRTFLSPRGLPGRSRPGFPRVGTFSCPLLPTISNGTLRTMHLASNTACRPACSFHPDDRASLKLA